ncbi:MULTISPECIES: hypothetical protein [unclassified Micromonospora]|uniref:hypothetical protein n=1 Tax=unclassified Micromonospora TaxID=2617518 RepID=UPI0033D53D99
MTSNKRSFLQRTSIAFLFAAVGAVSGIAQLVGGFIAGRMLIVWSAAITLALVGVAVGIDELWMRQHLQRVFARRAVLITTTAAVALSIGVGAGYLIAAYPDGRKSYSSSGQTPSPKPSEGGDGVVEIAGNRLGSPVFGDNAGRAAPAGVPRIPAGTHVTVICKAEDLTGMASVTYLYKIGTAPWTNLYSPSDTFRNGDPPEGGTTAFNPAVPDC